MSKANLKPMTWALVLYAVLSLGSMAMMGIGAAIAAVALIYGAGGPKGYLEGLNVVAKHPAYRKYAAVSLALLLALIFSLIGAELFPLRFGGRGSQVHFLTDLSKAWYLLWPLFLAPGIVAVGPQGRKTILRAWLLTFGVLSVLSFIQYFTGFPRPQSIPGTPRFHATLLLGHHLSVASIFIFPFFATLDLASRKDANARAGFSNRVLRVFAVLGVFCLFFTYSRTLWVALPLGIITWLCWALPPKRRLPALVGFGVLLALAALTPTASQRLRNLGGILPRVDLWQANWEFFKARPLTGVGWHHNIELSGYYLMQTRQEASVFSGHAHNNFIDILAGAGLFGAVTWLAWCFLTFQLLWPLARKGTSFARGLFCAWIVFQLNGLTQVNFWEAKVLHQIAWMTAWLLAWSLIEGKAARGKA